ncbi:MAG: lytic transglycosylase domain-containing protein [Acidobacteriota bacterium]|nr:lytic transglycosylase domain-containing protein [Acidobacteriota bacterium]
MRSKTLVVLTVLFALAAPGYAKVRILVKDGKKVVYNDGVGEKRAPSAKRSTGDGWLAARLSKPSEYDHLINQSASNHSLDPRLVKAVALVESGFNPSAISPKGARGLMQLMPATASRNGVNNVHDPAQNIAGGTRYLSHLLNLFDGNLEMSLAAYNAGEGAVARYGGIPPYVETRDYVRRALTAYYGAPYRGGSALGGGFGKASPPIRIERDSQNRPLLTTGRPSAPALRRLG